VEKRDYASVDDVAFFEILFVLLNWKTLDADDTGAAHILLRIGRPEIYYSAYFDSCDSHSRDGSAAHILLLQIGHLEIFYFVFSYSCDIQCHDSGFDDACDCDKRLAPTNEIGGAENRHVGALANLAFGPFDNDFLGSKTSF
jgi:hypothetical protein